MAKSKVQPLNYESMAAIMNSKDWSPAYRHPIIDKDYNKHKRELKKQGISTTDYILNMLNGREHLVTFNNFKYNFEGIHCLGWWIPNRQDIITGSNTVQQDLGQAITQIFYGLDYNVAENPNHHLRSVKGVRHYHIAVKYQFDKFHQWDLINYRINKLYNFDAQDELKKNMVKR